MHLQLSLLTIINQALERKTAVRLNNVKLEQKAADYKLEYKHTQSENIKEELYI